MDAKEHEERGRAIVQTLAAVIESMVHSSESIPMAYRQKTKFEAFRAPGISIRDYLMRIHKYASCSPECFVLALVYIDRLHQMHGLVLTELNVHRVLITSIVLAAKFFDDHYFNNAYYAKVGGVPCSEMNELEVEFLLLINFSLHVCTDTYTRYYNELANHYIFTSVRQAGTIPMAPAYRQLRHYVTEDPSQQGQLMYVTEGPDQSMPAAPKTSPLDVPMSSHHHHHHHHHVPHQHHHQIHNPQHHQHHNQLHQYHPIHQPAPQHHNHHLPTYDDAARSQHHTTGMTSNASRSSGQKRRSAVALGVNA